MKKLLAWMLVCTMLLVSMAAYATEAITVYDATDNVIENEFGDAEQIKANVNFVADETAENAKLMAARYDENGTLLTATSEDVEVVAGETVDFTSELVTIDGADTVKFLLWNGLDSIKPLTVAKTVSYTVEESDKFYAIITEATMEGEDNNVTIKAFAEEFGDDGWASLAVSNNVTLNGTSATSADVFNALNRDGVDGYRAPEGEIYPQPVKIIVNGNNEIAYMAQASVKEYYDSISGWGWGRSTGSYTYQPMYVFPEITEPSSFPDYEPEFQLYMGSPLNAGTQFAYRDIIGQPVAKYGNATVAKHPYSAQAVGISGATTLWRMLKPTTNTTVYQVPMYMDVTNTETIGKIAAQKTDLFTVSDIPRASSFKMMAYKEGAQSRVCSFCMNLVSADAVATTGNNFDIRLVVDITTENINGETVTVVNTDAGKIYIKPDAIDLNALPFYSYTQAPMNNPVTGEATYKVVPGDLINVLLNPRNYARAIEPVFDSKNGYFLGDYQYGSKYGKTYNQRNHRYCYGTREADNKNKLEWVTPEYVDKANDVIEGKVYNVATRDSSNGNPVTYTEAKTFTMMPKEYTNTTDGAAMDCILVGRDENGAITSRQATIEDITVGDGSVLLLSQGYMVLSGTSFIYPAEFSTNWSK